MPTIEEIAIETYQNNINYLQEKHESLYTKIIALETVMEDGRYTQKYDLEYKNDYFDIVDISSSQNLYNMNSNVYSKELTQTLNMKKSDHVIETFYNLEFTKEALDKANNANAETLFATSAPIISYYNELTTKEMHLKHLYKFVFLGLGLAIHLPSILKKFNPNILLLIENDLEIFRLSLFTCNYYQIFQNKTVYFSIAQNNDEFKATFHNFYDSLSIRNQFIKFSLFSDAYTKKIEEIQTIIVSRSEKSYTHERILYKNRKVLQRVQEGYNFFDLSKKKDEEFFTSNPVLVIGAGPSLHENIEWLKTHKNDFILFAAFASLKTLQKYNITPDLVFQLDEKVTEGTTLVNSFDNFDFIKNSLFLFAASVPDVYYEKFSKESIFLIEDRTFYKQDKMYIKATSVGEFIYSIALLFNTSKTYLLGLDLALTDDGSTHAKDHHATNKIDVSEKENISSVFSVHKSVITVKGNFQETVFTTPLLASSIPYVNNYTKTLKSDKQKVYNLSNGAYFEAVTPLAIQEYRSNTKNNIQQCFSILGNIFTRYSSSNILNNNDLPIINRKQVIKLYFQYLQNFQEAPTSNSEDFLKHYTDLIRYILNSPNSELKELLVVYIYNVASYVTDLFNTKEISNYKKHTKKLKLIIIIQFEKIINSYKDSLTATFNEGDEERMNENK